MWLKFIAVNFSALFFYILENHQDANSIVHNIEDGSSARRYSPLLLLPFPDCLSQRKPLLPSLHLFPGFPYVVTDQQKYKNIIIWALVFRWDTPFWYLQPTTQQAPCASLQAFLPAWLQSFPLRAFRTLVPQS